MIEVTRHPSADVATLNAPSAHGVEPFWNAVGNYSMGEDFMAYGYPEGVFGEGAGRPVPRVFRGHYQRFLDYQSQHLRYRYVAGEMSIPSPVGLSGGSVFRLGAPMMVTGLVTENLESMSGIRRIEEVRSSNKVEITKEMNVISYGVALMLDSVSDWTREAIPVLSSGELAAIRRRPNSAD